MFYRNKYYLLTMTIMGSAGGNKEIFTILTMVHVFQFSDWFYYLAVELQRVSNQKTNWNLRINGQALRHHTTYQWLMHNKMAKKSAKTHIQLVQTVTKRNNYPTRSCLPLLLKLKHSIMRGFSWNRIHKWEKKYIGVRCIQIFATKAMKNFPFPF
jgi:hypothetical protein